MARMIPPYISEDVKSSGERQFFKRLSTAPHTEDWVVLHSLNLSEHVKRIFGEIDFLILIPDKGVFVAELKSGGVECNDGVWSYIDRKGKKHKSNIGPFNQARDAMFTLKNYINKKLGKKHKLNQLLYGFCVIFPHTNFDVASIEFEHWQVYDRDNDDAPLPSFFNGLSMGFQEKYSSTKWFDINTSLPNEQEISELVQLLRCDFERIYTWSDRLDDSLKQQKILTEEQYVILDALNDNPRCLFQGGAGSGKTFLAIESSRRSFYMSRKTLLLCFNNLLSFWMEREMQDFNEYVHVFSFQRLLREICSGIDLSVSSGMPDQKFHEEFLPELALKVLRSGMHEQYDCIIIDEGQDLIRSINLEILDLLLKEGLRGGNWHIYADFDKQAIYSSLSKSQMLELIQNYSMPVMYRLSVNCRNTIRIGNETVMLTGSEKQSFLPSSIEGDPVEYFYYSSPSDQRSKLKKKIDEIKDQKDVSLDRIIILSPKAFHKTGVSELKEPKVVNLGTSFDGFSLKGKVKFCTIHGFKGLESDLIILTDIEHLDYAEFQSLLYVGMTRARSGLIVLTHERNKPVLKEILIKHAEFI